MKYCVIYVICMLLGSSLAFGQLLPPPQPPPHVYYDFFVTPNQPSLVGPDHTFEGSLIRISDTEILHLFRLDPGFEGNHVGNNGCIAKRMSYNNGVTWSEPQIVYNDEYDNRFSTAFKLDNGDIVAFFRRYYCYDTWSGVNVDSDMLISKDNGNTWSERIYLEDIGPSGCFMNVFKIHGIPGYFASTYANAYIDLRYSEDGYAWDSVCYVWDYRDSAHLQINEPYFASLGDGKVIGLFRAENRPIHQVVSFDSGKTWSQPTPTNIANGAFCPSPTITYSSIYDRALIVVTDRRGGNYDYINFYSGTWFYFAEPSQIMEMPLAYTLSGFLQRGQPNDFRMLGYPSVLETSDTSFVVLYSDAYKKHNSLEDADYYQTHVYINPDIYKRTQHISFDIVQEMVFDENPLILYSTSSSGLPVRFESTDTSVVTIDNNQLVFTGVGECDIVAYQDGNEHFFKAKPIAKRIQVAKASQEFVFEPLPTIRYSDKQIALPSNSSKNMKLKYEVTNTNVAQIIDSILYIVGVGNTDLVVTQEGNTLYEPFYAVIPISIDKSYQDIELSNIPLLYCGDVYTEVPRYSTASLPLTYTSSDTSIIKIENKQFIAVGAGQCEIIVQQFGSDLFYPVSKTEVVIVEKLHQFIEFETLKYVYGDSVIIPTVYASSGLPVQLVSSDTSIAQIVQNYIVLKKSGTVILTATQNGNKQYYSASAVSHEISVSVDVETIVQSEVQMFPNPSQGIVYVTNAQGKRVEVISMLGEVLLMQEKLYDDFIDLSELSNGVYTIRLYDDTNSESVNIVLHK
ncbi:MAG: BNR/Asp-box repeat protein [Bacteroidetes bacterium ADurb.Bin217]|nr:MAG: BNR/Asp-box repeat protein [Bacteroidetes bacterium ADurb.Bin217]